jgi:hypothetical protein
MADPVIIRQGQSAVFDGVWTPITGGVQNLEGVTVTSAVKDHCGNTVYGVVTVAPNFLDFTVEYTTEQTAAFALGSMNTDLKFAYGATVFFTSKGRLEVVDTVTK